MIELVFPGVLMIEGAIPQHCEAFCQTGCACKSDEDYALWSGRDAYRTAQKYYSTYKNVWD